MIDLNNRAERLARRLVEDSEAYRVDVKSIGGARVIDCGVDAVGGLQAGRMMARICMADLAAIRLVPRASSPGTGLAVTVITDQPLPACLAAQYAGWPISVDEYFAMGSGPMRHLRGREPILKLFRSHDAASTAVGILESGKLPSPAIVRHIADECSVEPHQLVLLVAPTRSLAGGFQIVARSVETALHKLHELTHAEHAFDMHAIVSAAGSAPLPPPAQDDMAAIGRTNDAILYGAEVTLWVEADDRQLAELTPRLPSSASKDYGEPFQAIFQRVGGDFYAIDPMLFSPAAVRMINLRSGNTFAAGEVSPQLLARSFIGDVGS